MGLIGSLEEFFEAVSNNFNLSPYYDFNTVFRVLEIDRDEFVGFLEDKYSNISPLAVSEVENMFSCESTVADIYRILSVY